MVVCVHGEITEYCEQHDMIVADRYDGALEDYTGGCPVIVTSQEMPAPEYLWLKARLWARGYELVSTQHRDDPVFAEYLLSLRRKNREKHGGRVTFGFQMKDGVKIPHPENMKVARRILELRDAGCTLKQIHEDEGVHKQDGGRLSISTIQVIIKNRERYE